MSEWRGYVVPQGVAEAPEKGACRAYRVLYTTGSPHPLTFVKNRITERGDTSNLRKWMIASYEEIQATVLEACFPMTSKDWGEYSDGIGVFRFTPGGSPGYMYCVTWLLEECTELSKFDI